MTPGRCPLIIFCARGTPPRRLSPSSKSTVAVECYRKPPPRFLWIQYGFERQVLLLKWFHMQGGRASSTAAEDCVFISKHAAVQRYIHTNSNRWTHSQDVTLFCMQGGRASSTSAGASGGGFGDRSGGAGGRSAQASELRYQNLIPGSIHHAYDFPQGIGAVP